MMTSATTNPRILEPRLAPRLHESLATMPPDPDEPHTEVWAMALVADAVHRKASDIHLEPGSFETRIRLRVDGVLHDVAALPVAAGHRLVAYFKTLCGIDATALAVPEHGSGSMESEGTVMELRTTVAPTPHGEMVGMRLLNTHRPIPQLEGLGMAEADQSRLRQWLEGRQGMLLVCGPVGCGKTSTLYSLLRELQSLPCSIVTVEDPVEFNLDGVTQIQVNAKRGLNFPEAIQAMLRLDADYLLVGEIRDPESAHVAITAAGTGLTVLSTIHARDAVGAVTALRNNGVKDWEIGSALGICVSQRLVRRLCAQCRTQAHPADEERQWFTDASMEAPPMLWHGKGCDTCAGTGFDGRVGIFETWRLDAGARKLILQGADAAALAENAKSTGTQSLLMDAVNKVREGVTSLSEIRFLGGIFP